MTTRRQSLRTYLLHAVFAVLIGAAALPLLQRIAPAALAEIGIETAPTGMLAFLGGYLGGSIYTACRWIQQCSHPDGWAEANRAQPCLRSLRHRQQKTTYGLIVIASLFLFIPIYLIALARLFMHE